MRVPALRLFLAAATALPVASPGPALAWRHHGGFGVFIAPGYVPPPVYVVPPYYVPQPYYYYPPPVAATPLPRRSCQAGAYACPMATDAPPGAACSCPTGTGRARGVVR